MEVTATAAQTLIAVGQCQNRSCETFTLGQLISRIVRIDTGKEMVVVALIGVDLQLVVATVAKGCTNDTTRVFLRFAIQREHHLGMSCLCIAHTILVFDDLDTRQQSLFGQTSLVGPEAIE